MMDKHANPVIPNVYHARPPPPTAKAATPPQITTYLAKPVFSAMSLVLTSTMANNARTVPPLV
ncbi:MAG: hypothetical protein QF704_08270 [Anaerolineales bacterium]|nr:hypothetical protein [Anaerolineales bacterium]MDP6770673.1 hypothetical protein [Anaerolineales bacterium]